MAELDFEKCTRDGVNQAMKECELTIGMTLAEAFEKQMPKAPAWGYCELWRCPICGCLGIASYCANCGQKIDWEAVDDEVREH